MEEEKLLEEYFNKLLELFKNRKSIEYEIIKSVKEEDHIQFTIKIRTLNQKRVIKFLNNEENNTYIKSDDEYSYFMVSLNKNILEKSFIQEEAYDNSEEIWRLHILSNNKLKKENGAYYYDNDIDIEISGDVVFNFNDKKCKLYEDIINQDKEFTEEVKKCILDMLEKCKNMHNSPQNVSMIIKTGGLNNFKQGIANDRMDVFICEINNYYEGNKLRILEHGCMPKNSFSNRQELEKIMTKIGEGKEGFNNFVLLFYHLKDERLIESIIQSGHNRIKDCRSLYRYMCLAYEYWLNAANYYCNYSENCKKYYLEMQNAKEPASLNEEYLNQRSILDCRINMIKGEN